MSDQPDIPSTPGRLSTQEPLIASSDLGLSTPGPFSENVSGTPARTPKGMYSSNTQSDMARSLFMHTPRRRANINSQRATPRVSGLPRRENVSQTTNDVEAMQTDGAVPQQTMIWGTDVSVEGLEKTFTVFFSTFKADESDSVPLYRKLMETTKLEGLSYINVNCSHLFTFDPNVYVKLVQFPAEVVPVMDYVAAELYHEWCGGEEGFLTTRPYNLKEETSMRDLNPEDVDKLVAVRGMVIRCSPVIPDMTTAFFRCVTCRETEEVELLAGRIREPERCSECGNKLVMEIVHNRCSFLDKQVLKVQEAPEIIPAGQTPLTVVMVCYDDYVDVVQPGDRVEVTGIFRAQSMRPNKNFRTLKSVFRTHLDVVHYKKTDHSKLSRRDVVARDSNVPKLVDDQPDAERQSEAEKRFIELSKSPDIYQRLVKALAPSIWGQDDVKKGLLCQLLGGSSKNFEEHGFGRFRGDINILLCGDPSTSKSQFLTAVHKLAARGIYTSGKGSSSVGLTAYVTRDPDTKELVLESGALVLSDGGTCCIDEFDKMTESTRSVLHEAMEQQTVSIAKAGIICTLNARTSILAAANPVNSAWDPKLSVIENLQLPPTLISRFDLIYLILDKVDELWDRRLATHIVGLYDQERKTQLGDSDLTTETFTQYIEYARSHVQPQLSDAAAAELVESYTEMRRVGQRSKTVTATPRQLESLIRLSEALAKTRLSEVVERSDVIEAVRLVQSALLKVASDPKTGLLNMDLLTTGFSASERKAQDVVMQTLKTYHESQSASRGKLSITYGNLLKLLHEEGHQDLYKDQSELSRVLQNISLTRDIRHEVNWMLRDQSVIFHSKRH